jgi:hypothetical protein
MINVSMSMYLLKRFDGKYFRDNLVNEKGAEKCSRDSDPEKRSRKRYFDPAFRTRGGQKRFVSYRSDGNQIAKGILCYFAHLIGQSDR